MQFAMEGSNKFVWYQNTSTGAANTYTPTASMTLDASGNLGIGITSPNSYANYKTLSVFGTNGGEIDMGDGTTTRLNFYTTSTSVALNAVGAIPLTFGTNGSERARIDSSGNLGVGTTSPTFATGTGLQVKGAGFTSVRITGGSNTGLDLSQSSGGIGYVYLRDNQPLVFGTNDTERARIDSSGQFLVGITSLPTGAADGICLQAGNGNVKYSVGSTGNVYQIQFLNPNGVVGGILTNGSATTYSTSSDYRLKENIAPMTGALAKVAALKPVTYKWKVDGSDGEGFIAHELAEVCPQAVAGEKDATRIEQYEISPAVPATFDEDGNELTPAVEAVMGEREVPVYQGIDTSFLVATLVAALQEANGLIKDLQTRVEALEAK